MSIRATLFFTIALCAFPLSVAAYVPVIMPTPEQNDVLSLPTPTVAQVFYGELSGYPQMYEFYTKQSIELFVEVNVPKSDYARTNVSGIILRVEPDGGVTEIARLSAKDASWEQFFDWWSGDRYMRGASYRGLIEKGTYRVEVSTPDNINMYALRVGVDASFFDIGYFERIERIADVKTFLGKPSFRILESPVVYGPLVALLICIGTAIYSIRRYRTGLQ